MTPNPDSETRATDDNELANLLGPFWSEERVCAALRLTPDALRTRCVTGTVLGLTTADGRQVYPVSQFQRQDGQVEVKPALVTVLQALCDFDPWTVATLLHTPAPELDGASPLSWVNSGASPEPLARLARTVAREWRQGDPH